MSKWGVSDLVVDATDSETQQLVILPSFQLQGFDAGSKVPGPNLLCVRDTIPQTI